MNDKSKFFKAIAVAMSVAVAAVFGAGGNAGSIKWSISEGSTELEIGGINGRPGVIPDFDFDNENYAPWSGLKRTDDFDDLFELLNSISNAYILKIKSIKIDKTVTSIGKDAFYGFIELQSVKFIPNSVVVSIGESAFKGCERLEKITIPNSVTTIGNSAFKGCESLEKITIPNSVASIGDSAFWECSGLTEITNQSTTPQPIKNLVSNPWEIKLYVPEQSFAAYKAADGWRDFNIQAPTAIGKTAAAKQALTISFAGIRNGEINLNLKAGNYTAELYNVQGRLVSSVNINALNGLNATGIKTNNLSKGMFILNVKQAGASVLKQKLRI